MASLDESGKYGLINRTYKVPSWFYVIMFTSEAYTHQYNTTIDRQIITTCKLVGKAQYLCSVQVKNNWYWNQHTQQHVITVPTLTILRWRLQVNAIIYFHDIAKHVSNRKQAKKAISRHPICLPDSSYDSILEEIGHRYKIEFEIDVEVHSDYETNWYENIKLILYVFLIYLYINYHQIILFIYLMSILCFRLFICMHRINIIQVFMFTFLLVMKGMNQLFNWCKKTISSLGALLSKCISQHKNLFQTYPLFFNQRTIHKSYTIILYSVLFLLHSLSQISSTKQHWYHYPHYL